MTWFNAGLRIFDLSDEHLPREAGYFVLVDARGVIHLPDKVTGRICCAQRTALIADDPLR